MDDLAVEPRVGPGEVHELEKAQAGVDGLGGEGTDRTPAGLVDDHHFARLEFAHKVRTDDIERGGLRREYPTVVEPTEAQRTEPVGVANTEHSLLVHEDQRERPTQTRQHVEQRSLEMRRLARLRRVVRVRADVERQEFGQHVAVATHRAGQHAGLLGQLVRVHQVSVVTERELCGGRTAIDRL